MIIIIEWSLFYIITVIIYQVTYKSKLMSLEAQKRVGFNCQIKYSILDALATILLMWGENGIDVYNTSR